ncbi:MAG: hypothetical protein JXB13_06920 [Phycisphaerae bacterium]|nr:hypothetical protein [Phycisphaerae bacterium]
MDGQPEKEPRCLYCGYSLRGLPEETSCPECGMRNIPEALRREVWDLVDNRRRLWREMFSIWRKHPPGWWWSLDRPGDLRRAIVRFVLNLIVSLVIITAGVNAFGSIVLVEEQVDYCVDASDPSKTALGTTLTSRCEHGFLGVWLNCESEPPEGWSNADYIIMRKPGISWVSTTTQGQGWHWTSLELWFAGAIATWACCLWASIAMVGLWTQIRRRMKTIGRAWKTIIAASCTESCKLVYLAGVIAIAAAVDAGLRITVLPGNAALYEAFVRVMVLGVVCIGVLGWIGPLRSDYTGQLIRSRVHLVRILIMYAVVFPWLLMLLIWCVVFLLARPWE